jgi:cytochrome oxidase Cu insertion factor (SCO1/SenC/PrrC family)
MTEAPVTPPPVPRRYAAGTTVAVVLIVAGIIAAIVINQKRKATFQGAQAIIEASSKRAEDLPVLGTVAPFTLKERSGQTVTLDLLLGRVWVADYFFTYCGGPCPKMNRNMGKLHREFIGRDEPKFVSITADPARDTLDAMTEHAKMIQADTERWWFLTGDQKELKSLATSLLLPYEIGNPSAHSTKFVLIDREGRIRGAYSGVEDQEVASLRRDLALLLAAQQDR